MSNSMLSLTLVDSYGRTTVKRVEIEDHETLADYLDIAGDYTDALEDVTDLGLVRCDLILQGFQAGFDVTEGSNVDVGATFVGFIHDGNGKKASLKLPGIKASLVDPDGSVPIEGVTETWLDLYEFNGDAMLSDGEQIDSWISGALDK